MQLGYEDFKKIVSQMFLPLGAWHLLTSDFLWDSEKTQPARREMKQEQV